MNSSLTQGQRAIALLMDASALLVVSRFAFGSFLPPIGDKGFWFYTALLSVLVGSRLVTPFYVKPVDAFAYAAPAFIALMLSNQWPEWTESARIAYVAAIAIAATVGGASFAAIAFNNLGVEPLQRASARLKLLVREISNPAIIYAPILIFSMVAYHRDSPNELIAITISMLFVVTFSIGALSVRLVRSLVSAIAGGESSFPVAEVFAHHEPAVFLLRATSPNGVEPEQPVLLRDEILGDRLAYTTDTVGRERGQLIRAIDLGEASTSQTRRSLAGVGRGQVVLLSDPGAAALQVEKAKRVIGYVAQNSTVSTLYVEVAIDRTLEVGRLVSVPFRGRTVLYQLVGGLTREEAVHQKNTYGYVRAQAQQVGVWEDQRFAQSRWVPQMHTPVQLEGSMIYEATPQTIGRFPETAYTTELGNIDQLVTHNTAILGILGVGKSMLAIELVERMLASGIKVICLDLTNQYASELSEFLCADRECASLKSIQDACEADRNEFANSPSEGGSLHNLQKALLEDLQEFLDDENPRLLKIYNPSDFNATWQEYEPKSYNDGGTWHRGAALYSVTPVQATQAVSEAVLATVSDRMTDSARVCLVYEEAHALIPEWNSVVVEGDKRATSGSARAILQGRKYGLGCLLVTQRTANVTKTILNQCNTIFAMRTYDETGKDFLANYIGKDYAEDLSSLPERHAVFFGRASNCENPVLIRLNDRDAFLAAFRAAHPLPSMAELCGDPEVSDAAPAMGTAQPPDFDDDVAF